MFQLRRETYLLKNAAGKQSGKKIFHLEATDKVYVLR